MKEDEEQDLTEHGKIIYEEYGADMANKSSYE